MNRSKNIFTNGNLVPMCICTPIAIVLSALLVTLLSLLVDTTNVVETFLYSCLLFLGVALIIEVPLLIIDAIKLIRYKVLLKRELKRKDENFVLIINNGGLYLEVFEFASRREAVSYKLKLIAQKDSRPMIVTTVSCAEKCYGINREEEQECLL